MADDTRPEYGSDEHRRAMLRAMQKWLLRPDSKYRFVASASPAKNGENWMALLIATPSDTCQEQNGSDTTSSDSPQSDKKGRTLEAPSSNSQGSPRPARKRHTTDIAPLLGLAHHLL